ncbi:hypothetical protein Pyn_08744 [Prunus yedoensis var. nudiflora]|uniref:Uncharacterized protein n=1 Tax=Prunus yedoensis var. nudiflora TaxID=2094558 RepID=A0A314XXK2_PRUYE|nr:hypothetical protein Pyn_08744 [Prunus yedoensis var. nudiflora]
MWKTGCLILWAEAAQNGNVGQNEVQAADNGNAGQNDIAPAQTNAAPAQTDTAPVQKKAAPTQTYTAPAQIQVNRGRGRGRGLWNPAARMSSSQPVVSDISQGRANLPMTYSQQVPLQHHPLHLLNKPHLIEEDSNTVSKEEDKYRL